MSYGSGPYGGGPFGGGGTLFAVLGATSINPFTVVITFTAPPDLSSPVTLDVANYDFSGDLQPLEIVPDTDPNSLRVITTEQDYQLYTVTVSPDVEGLSLVTVDPLYNEVEFTGFPSAARFIARPVSATRINLVFHQSMLVNANLSNPLNYSLQAVSGAPGVVVSATPNLLTNATRVILEVNAMSPGVPYVVAVSSNVETSDGKVILPPTSVFIWSKTQLRTSVPLSKFTGEVRAIKSKGPDLSETLRIEEAVSVIVDPTRYGPSEPEALKEELFLSERLQVQGSGFDTKIRHAVQLSETIQFVEKAAITKNPDFRSTVEMSLSENVVLREDLEILPELPVSSVDPGVRSLFGNPEGLVFFSPALKLGGSSQSSIQVDKVETCTQAYDKYSFPQPIDPLPLFTHGVGVVPTPVATTLNTGVLFAGFYRLAEAKLNLQDSHEEEILPLVDIGATITLTQVLLPEDVSLLNSTTWALFNNVVPPPYVFTTADNLSPFPPSVVTIRRHFVNPAEVLHLGESLGVAAGTSIGVAETLGIGENFDLVPGEGVVQVNLAESMSIVEGLETAPGVNLFETLSITEELGTL